MVYPGQVFEHLESEFVAALEACRVEPDRESVHRLRTSARRLEALLQTAKRRRPGGAEFARQIDKALKALKPVRSAAGPVRDMDVQRELLEGLSSSGAGRPTGEREALSDDGRRLGRELKKRRKQAGEELAAVTRASADDILKRISHLPSVLAGMEWKLTLKDARGLARRSLKGLDLSDSGSLHSYRKRTKFARYLAEMDKESARAQEFAKRLKKVLNLIGEWHDWMLLSALAKETLGKSSTLTRVLKQERQRSLRRAIRSVERFQQEL